MIAPTVSVVIATYNRARLLACALDSVAAQTFSDWECLVCDDGSIDGTRDLVRARVSADPRFRFVSGKRAARPAVPRNRGIHAARGRWISFLDDDDLWHPAKLERQLRIADGHGCDAVSARAVPFFDGSPPGFSGLASGSDSVQSITLADLLLRRAPQTCTSSTMVSREAVLRAGGFAESPAYRAVEDFDLWLRLLAAPNLRWVVDTGDALTAYRDQGEDSISSWYRVLDPDVIRQRWAVLESSTRMLAVSPVQDGDERAAVLDALIRRADECAGRCQAVGWHGAAAAAYTVAAIVSMCARQPRDVALWFYRAARVRCGRRNAAAPALPAALPVLMRRSLGFALRILIGARSRPAAVPVDFSTRWSDLATSDV